MKKNFIFHLFLLGAVIFIIFSNTYENNFVCDDVFIISDNPDLKEWDFLFKAFSTPYWNERNFLKDAKIEYRPLTMVTYLVESKLLGFKPGHFHFINILLHFFCTLLFYQFVQAIFKEKLLSLLSALFFAVHPVHVEAVTGIVGRAELLTFFFVLLSLLCHFYSLKYLYLNKKLYYLSLFFFLAALLSKENGITFIPLILAVHFTTNVSNLRTIIKLISPYLIISAGYFAYRYSLLGVLGEPPFGQCYQGIPLPERFLLVCNVFNYAIYQMFYPLYSCADYSHNALKIVFRFSEIDNILYMISFLFFCSLPYLLYKIGQIKFAFGLFWFLVCYLPVTGIFPVGIVFAERTLYLPSAGLFLILGLIISALLKNNIKEWLLGLFIIIIFVSWSLITVERNYDWKDDFSLWQSSVNSKPNSYKAQLFLGKELFMRGKFREAIDHLVKSVEIFRFGAFNTRYYHLGVSYFAMDDYLQALLAFYTFEKNRRFEDRTISTLKERYFCLKLLNLPALAEVLQNNSLQNKPSEIECRRFNKIKAYFNKKEFVNFNKLASAVYASCKL